MGVLQRPEYNTQATNVRPDFKMWQACLNMVWTVLRLSELIQFSMLLIQAAFKKIQIGSHFLETCLHA